MKGFNLKIKGKLLLVTLSIISSLFIIISLIFIFSINAMSENNLETYREDEVNTRKGILREHTQIVFDVIRDIYAGETRDQTAEADLAALGIQLLGIIKEIRYDGGVGYFWVNDTSQPVPRMIMHPTDSSLDGIILDDPTYNCAYGTDLNLFSAFVDLCLTEGSGFVDYLWPKPTEDGLTEKQLKISYVRLFEPFGWVVGTGLYFDDIDKAILARRENLEQYIGKMLLNVLLVFMALIFVSVIVLIAFCNSISRRLIEVTDMAGKIADGDLTMPEVDSGSGDELGLLAHAFNKMLDSLRYKLSIINKIAEGAGDFTVEVELASDKDVFGKTLARMLDSLNRILGQVNKAVDYVAVGTNQVAQASQVLSQGAVQQAAALQEITAAVMEISTQAKESTSNAHQASTLARKARENADNGNQKMKDLVGAMREINQSADMIKNIVKIINDIAFQTNLLALNANVEAAHAGRFGKGFAVVADEVRNLAGKSAGSVEETTQMVEEILTNMKTGNDLVGIMEKQFDEIIDSSGKVMDLVESIEMANKEQTHGLDQINQSLTQIDQVTQANTASAEESASALEELAGQAHQLKETIAKFKLVRRED